MSILVFLIAIASIIGIAVLYTLMINFHPGPSRIQRDLEEIKKTIESWGEELAPLKKEEFELLSHNQTNQAFRNRVVTATAEGVITSIYEEPLVAYGFKRYFGKPMNGMLYARTMDKEFFYRFKHGQVKLNLNDQFIGIIKEKGALFSPQGKELLAKIDYKQNSEMYPVLVNGKEVASIIVEDKELRSNTRALEFVSPMKKEEEVFFLALTILELVMEDLPEGVVL